jgi:hypothetical protein
MQLAIAAEQVILKATIKAHRRKQIAVPTKPVERA